MHLLIKRLIFIWLLLPFVCFAQAPQPPSPQNVQGLVAAIDSFARRMPAEKVYLHLDKPYYSNIDTIWLKAYVLNDMLAYSQQSAIMYTELVNDTGIVVLRQAMPVVTGVGLGQIVLNADLIPEGSYLLRAYTNWMQNAGPETFFTRQLFISNADTGSWLLKAGNKTSIKNGKLNTEMAVQLTEQDNTPVRLRDLQLRVMQGRKTWTKQKLQTDLDGRLSFNFDIPNGADAKRLNIVAEDINKGTEGRRLVMPLKVQRVANTDVQFMPEGGQLVAGLATVIGIKAIGEDGLGVDVSGSVIDSKGAEAATFKTTYKGIGSFPFTPSPGEKYTAKVSMPGGETVNYPLPAVKAEGLVLRISNTVNGVVIINVQGTAKYVNNNYSLVALAGNVTCYAAKITLKETGLNGRLLTSKFPTGIVRFMVLGQNNQPLAARMLFVDHHDRLKIAVTPAKQVFAPADSANLNLLVTDANNKPAQGSFSIAITNNAQVKADSTNTADIAGYMLLTGNLKGNIEEPGYYFKDSTMQTKLALDNLMLTQGWVGYDWDKVISAKQPLPKFKAEKEMAITGNVDRMGKPQQNMPVQLLATKKGLLVLDTLTDKNGRFVFNSIPLFDTLRYRLEAKDKKGKFFKVSINVDEFEPPDTKGIEIPRLTPWYVNSDSTLLNYNRQNISNRKESEKLLFPGGGISLKQVNIRAKRVIKDSKNLNGSGEADQVLGEKELLDIKKYNLVAFLIAKVKGFHPFKMMTKGVKFIMDGIPLDFYYDPGVDPDHDRFLYNNLGGIHMEDIKGIEVMYSEGLTSKYVSKYDPNLLMGSMFSWPVYIEITSWSGNALFSRYSPGVTVFQPIALTRPLNFYQPKYTVANKNVADTRSTIYWAPLIVSNAEGKATVSFNTGPKTGTYTYILQGSDLTGAVGYARGTLQVK
jgi:hypothetical protein